MDCDFRVVLDEGEGCGDVHVGEAMLDVDEEEDGVIPADYRGWSLVIGRSSATRYQNAQEPHEDRQEEIAAFRHGRETVMPAAVKWSLRDVV